MAGRDVQQSADTVSQTATIANGASLSDAVAMNEGHYPIAIIMPAAWTAASLTFQASVDGSTYNNLYDTSNTEVSVSTAASRAIRLDPADWAWVSYLKVRSGTGGVPVNQGAERLITIVSRPV
jgi:hypothetical protein